MTPAGRMMVCCIPTNKKALSQRIGTGLKFVYKAGKRAKAPCSKGTATT